MIDHYDIIVTQAHLHFVVNCVLGLCHARHDQADSKAGSIDLIQQQTNFGDGRSTEHSRLQDTHLTANEVQLIDVNHFISF